MDGKTVASGPGTKKRMRMARAGTAIAAIAALGGLLSCRSGIPAGEPHAVLPPTAPVVSRPDVEACWVETGRFGASTASGVLVRHPAGDLIIDPGTRYRFYEALSDLPTLPRLWYTLVTARLRADVPVGDTLREMGASPERLTGIMATHLHGDHVGGAVDLPGVPVWLDPAEIAFAGTAGAQGESGSLHRIPADVAALSGRTRPLPFRPVPYEIFDESADFFGDGTVVAVPLHGHTPGSIGVFVNLGPTVRLFLVGDAVNDLEAIDERKGKAAWLRITDQDEAAADRTVATLAALRAAHAGGRGENGITFLPAHGRPAWTTAFPAGPKSCLRGS
jgi:glyoxylase-like metal-dependent hydrolase (beta-lactamase superfamily II)